MLLAEYTLVRSCASSYGIKLAPFTEPPADPSLKFLNDYASSMRPITMSQAQTIGYSLPSTPEGNASKIFGALDRTESLTVRGYLPGPGETPPKSQFILDGGCVGQASRELTAGESSAAVSQVRGAGVFGDSDQMAQYLQSAFAVGDLSSTVTAARSQWASCMSSHGYTGLKQMQDAIVANGPDPTSAKAIREAERDVACKQQVKYLPIWVASMTKAQTTVINQNQLDLEHIQQRLRLTVTHAAAVLSR